MLAVALVYLGFLVILAGAISLLKPLTLVGICSRVQGISIFGIGLLIVALGWILPAKEMRVTAFRTHLDQFMPVYQFNEVHSVRIMAPKDRAYRAIKAVTPDEILLFRTLTWIRRLGRPGPENILNAPEHLALLDVATRTGFLLLAEEPDHEIVVGTAVMTPRERRPQTGLTPEDFKTIREPGFAIATMNFLVQDAGPGLCTVTTETRVYATDASARRRFARYWRVIYPGSALIRRMWLQAVKRRAEAPS